MRAHTLPSLVFALACGSAQAAMPNMKEGMWEIITKTEMSSQSGVAIPQQAVRQCLTRKDIEDPGKTTPGAGGRDGRCKLTDYKLQGNTARWKMVCDGEGGMTGAGSVTYNGDSYSGTQTMSMKGGGQAMNMKMTYTGRRIGDCPKK